MAIYFFLKYYIIVLLGKFLNMFFKIILNLLVFLSFIVAGTGQAYAVESILSTSVRKSANDGLSFTFYTNNDVSEAPIVKDKGNNNYVILLPNLKDVSGVKPDLRTVSDVVSDVSVKTVNEGAVTYTKVTLTTKKPVKVSVDTRKTSQSTKELTGVNDIIAKVNLINQDIKMSKNEQLAVLQQPVVNNFASVKDVLDGQANISVQKPMPQAKKVETQKVAIKPAVSVNKVSAHVPANTKTIKKETKNLQDENIKNIQAVAVKNIDKIEENVKSSVENNVTVNDDETEFFEDVESVDLEPIPMLAEEKMLQDVKNKENLLASPLGLLLFFVLVGVSMLVFMFKKMSLALGRDSDFSGAFVERMNMSINSNKKDYSNIAQDKNMSWQEKYQSFKSGKIQEQKESVNSHIGMDMDDDLDIVEDVEDELDMIYVDRVEPEQVNPFASNADFLSQGSVVDSGDVISGEMRRTLKGFVDADKSLTKIKRNTGLKNRFTSFEKGNPELLQRNIHDLLETVIKIDEDKTIVESSKGTTEVVKSAYEQVREIEMNKALPVVENATSPIVNTAVIAQEKRKLKIKESRAIDDNKGFYLVDMNDKLALMGRINDKFTVLKKFDDMDKNTLQVRRDKDNLYMVRTNGFKALVGVDEDKMGVFAEL